MKIKCKICGKVIEHEEERYAIRKFLSHLRRIHDISKETYMINYELNGVQPKCHCGCGNNVKIGKGWNKWYKYYEDHKNTQPPSEEVILKIKQAAQEKRDNLWYYRNVNIKIINDSFDDFYNSKLQLCDISQKYSYDKRTLRDMWISYNKITYEDYKKISSRNNCLLASIRKEKKLLLENDFYEEIYKFIINNPYKYNIKQINELFGNKHTQTTLFKRLEKLYGNSFADFLLLGYASKEESFFIDILRFYFGATNVKQGFKLENKLYDAIIFNNILLEYDGSHYHKTEEQVNNDKTKNEIALKNNYAILRCNEKSIKNIDFLKQIEKWKNIN